MAIGYALCCLVLTGWNDLLFRFFARKPRSRGMFAAVIGMVWLLAAAGDVSLKKDLDWKATLFWGAVSGIFSAGGNLLLIEAMTKLSAGVCSTVYRLNLVPVVLGASLLLGEKLSVTQWTGTGCALLAVVLFFPKTRKDGKTAGGSGFVSAAFGMALAAAMMRAGMGLSYRYGFLHGADRPMVVVIDALFWIFGGLIYAWKREKCMALPEKKVLGYGILSGILVTGIVFFMALSLQYGDASVVLPVAQMSFLLTAVLGAVMLKEKLTPRVCAALGCGALAVILLSV